MRAFVFVVESQGRPVLRSLFEWINLVRKALIIVFGEVIGYNDLRHLFWRPPTRILLKL